MSGYALPLAVMLLGQAGNELWREISLATDATMRFVVIEREPNGPDRFGNIAGTERLGHVLVYEYISLAGRLRLLYERDLVSSRFPLVTKLSSDGRFYITMDDASETGIGPQSLVVYDLARNEHSTYAATDFLPADIVSTLPRGAFTAGFQWNGGWGEFNRSASQFFPNTPEDARNGLPFVVVDLPSRTARLEAKPMMHYKDVLPYTEQDWYWSPSKETVDTGNTVLPASLWRIITNHPQGDDGQLKQVFRLSANRQEYVLVGNPEHSRNTPAPPAP